MRATTFVVRSSWLVFAVWLSGCAGPLAPTSGNAPAAAQSAPGTAVLVQTYYYADQNRPFAGVAVQVNGAPAGTTGRDGTLTVDVPIGGYTTIEVGYAGYRSASASGAVRGPGERWSFWLMSDQ